MRQEESMLYYQVEGHLLYGWDAACPNSLFKTREKAQKAIDDLIERETAPGQSRTQDQLRIVGVQC